MHSDLDVGLDSANMTGRALNSAIACSTSRLNVRPTAATPDNCGGLERADRCDEIANPGVLMRVRQLMFGKIGAAPYDQAVRIDQPIAPPRLVFWAALRDYGRDDKPKVDTPIDSYSLTR